MFWLIIPSCNFCLLMLLFAIIVQCSYNCQILINLFVVVDQYWNDNYIKCSDIIIWYSLRLECFILLFDCMLFEREWCLCLLKSYSIEIPFFPCLVAFKRIWVHFTLKPFSCFECFIYTHSLKDDLMNVFLPFSLPLSLFTFLWSVAGKIIESKDGLLKLS